MWDFYWEMIDLYGYDPTWNNTESGNFRAIQIIVDGLKLQPCDPGLLEGRDALIDADQLNFQGQHECLLWQVFARRGMGVDAFAGNTDDRYDNVDGFQIPSNCEGQLTLKKEMTPTIRPGDEIQVTFEIENFDQNISNAQVEDFIPEGTVLTNVSDGVQSEVDGNRITFTLGDIAIGETQNFSYSLSTNDVEFARFFLYDDMEGPVQFDRTTSNEDLRGWALTTSQSSSGIFALRVAADNIGGE